MNRRLQRHRCCAIGSCRPSDSNRFGRIEGGSQPGTAIRTARGFDVIQEEGQPSRLFAVEEYGVNIMRVLRTLVVAVLMATTAWTSTRAADRVDLLLVLAADVSGSMDEPKFELQRSGYAAAFSNPRVIEALRGGPKRARRRRVHRMVGRFDLMRGVDGTFLVVVTFASHR